MDHFAIELIRTFGGTSAVARHLEAPTSTVHSWRQIGIPASRLAHLKLVAQVEGIAVDWATGKAPVGVEDVPVSMAEGSTPTGIGQSSGKAAGVTSTAEAA